MEYNYAWDTTGLSDFTLWIYHLFEFGTCHIDDSNSWASLSMCTVSPQLSDIIKEQQISMS